MNGILETFAILGCIQALLLVILFLFRRTNFHANRFLALWLFAYAIWTVLGMAGSEKYKQDYPHLIALGGPIPFLFGPLLYIYTRTLCDRGSNFRRRDLWHLAPFLIGYAYFSTNFYLLSGQEKLHLLNEFHQHGFPLFYRLLDSTIYVSGFGYSLVTFMMLMKYRRRLKHELSNCTHQNLWWLSAFVAAQFPIWMVAVFRSNVWVGATGTIGVYGLAIVALFQPKVFGVHLPEVDNLQMLSEGSEPPSSKFLPTESSKSNPVGELSRPQANEMPEQRIETKNTEIPLSEKYKKTKIEKRRLLEIKDDVLRHLEEKKSWLDPDLTVDRLAERLDVPSHHLSQTINTLLGESFFELINRYRITEACRLLKQTDSKMLTIAMESGFNSKSTFNSVFKKIINQTPSEYRELNKN